MDNTTTTAVFEASEKEQLDERFYGYINDALDWCENHKKFSFLILSVIIIFVLLLICKGIIKKIGPLEFDIIKKAKSKSMLGKRDRRITTLPASKPTNSQEELNDKLNEVVDMLAKGVRKSILIKCNDQKYASEIGKLFYSKLDEQKIGDHIGWIHYSSNKTEKPTIETCMYKELSIFSNEDKIDVRRSKIIGLFDNKKIHTILFIDIKEYNESVDVVLERYNNLKGLSIILMANVEIDGYDTYIVENNKDSGELLCK